MKDSSHTAITSAPVPTDWPDSTCLGRTCLKWGSDGELTTVDLLLVLGVSGQKAGPLTLTRQTIRGESNRTRSRPIVPRLISL